jgi:hypothetical protein
MGLPVTYSFSFYHALQKKFTGSIKERLCISFRYSSWFFSVVDIFPPCHLTFHDHILITLVEIFMIFFFVPLWFYIQLNVFLLSEPSKDLGFAMWVRSLTQMLLSMDIYVQASNSTAVLKVMLCSLA